ncbi:MAG: citrate synthase [Gammaproteobacteria bacterium]|nr:citrate synthase [Gammaproteobacteria bacterium]
MSDTLSIRDNRTGKEYEVDIVDGNISATQLRQIKVNEGDFGMMSYDPGYLNTASCTSRITDLHGSEGILRYRGYPIEQLAEKSTFLDVVYLLFNGELPNAQESAAWEERITHHTMLHEKTKRLMGGFNYDAHPMGVFISTVAALSTFYPEAKQVDDAEARMLSACRLIGKTPTIASYAYRNSRGLPYIYPDNELSYTGNFLNMMYRMVEPRYQADPVLERALDVLFILHADHEQNCSTSAMRNIASSKADPFVSVAGAAAALYGPSHGGANEAVLNMLREIGTKDKVADYVKRCKSGEIRLMGFGHRVYKNYDPRARIVKQTADEVFEVTGRNPLIDVAMELERIALEDDYFVKRNLYPNVDFYSGLIYEAMGFPMEAFTVLFAIPRTAGWLAQWMELMEDPEFRITRPRQNYQGSGERNVPDNYRS